jgi:hypothetical protein
MMREDEGGALRFLKIKKTTTHMISVKFEEK